MNNQGILKLRYKICNLSLLYRKTEKIWQDGSFQYSLKINGDAYLEISKEDVCVDELKNTIKNIDQQSEIWLYIHRIKSLSFSEAHIVPKKIYYEIEEISRTFVLTRENIDVLIELVIKSYLSLLSPGPLPQIFEFPNYNINLSAIDDNLKRLLITYIETKKLSSISENYYDDMLKRWFLILEDLEGWGRENGLNDDYKNIKSARNFVSHKSVHNQETMETIKQELSAYVSNSGRYGEASFDRSNQDHIDFIKKYTGLAETRVRYLLEQKLSLLERAATADQS